MFGVHVGLGNVLQSLSQKENKHLKRSANTLEQECPSKGGSGMPEQEERPIFGSGGAGAPPQPFAQPTPPRESPT